MHTFFLPPEDWSAPFALQGQEARHALKVLRVKPGERVRCFDGAGRHGVFAVTAAGKERLDLHAEHEERQEAGPATVLAVGWSKAARRGWLLEKAAELGAAGLWFWRAERSQGDIPDSIKESWLGPLLAGCKQSGNARLPGLEMAGPAAKLTERFKDFARVFVPWEAAERPLTVEDLREPGPVLAVIGPEGGMTRAETEAFAAAGAVPVTLGPHILRYETAALACLSLRFWARSK